MADDEISCTDTGTCAQDYWYNIAILSVLVFGSLVVVGATIIVGFKRKWHRFSEVRIQQFTKTCVPIPVNEPGARSHLWKGLLTYRIIIATFCVFTFFFTWFHDIPKQLDNKDLEINSFYYLMSFYTIWNFLMLIAYFLLVIILTILDLAGKAHPMLVHVLGNIAIILYNIEVALVFLVDSVLWLLIFPVLLATGNQSAVINFTSFVEHGFNLFFMLAELMFNQLPIRWFNMTWMTIWAIIYVIWAMIFYATTGLWRYPFLNLWTPYAMFWYFLVFIAHFVFFALCFALYKLKLKVVKRLKTNGAAYEFDTEDYFSQQDSYYN